MLMLLLDLLPSGFISLLLLEFRLLQLLLLTLLVDLLPSDFICLLLLELRMLLVLLLLDP